MALLQPGSDEWLQEQFQFYEIEEKVLIPVTEEQIAHFDFDENMGASPLYTDSGLCGGPEYVIPQEEIRPGSITVPPGMVLPPASNRV